jgi:prophage regulatory protein
MKIYVKILRLAAVVKKTGLSRAMLYKLMKNGAFPLNIHISMRSVGWVDSEVENWMEDRLKLRAAKGGKATTGGGGCL